MSRASANGTLPSCPTRRDLGSLPLARFLKETASEGQSALGPAARGAEGNSRLPAEGVPRAVDSILQGPLWVSRDVLERFSGHEKRLLERQRSTGNTLTARERQVLQFLMRGLTNKEISHLTGTSERTIKFHVSNILGKLHLEDRRMLSPDRLQALALRARA